MGTMRGVGRPAYEPWQMPWVPAQGGRTSPPALARAREHGAGLTLGVTTEGGSMRLSASRVRVAVAALVVGVTTLLAGAGGAGAATPIPAHVYAPYFETWTSD